jgi:hypothetical protein
MSAHALRHMHFVEGSSFTPVHQKFLIIAVSFARNFFEERILDI